MRQNAGHTLQPTALVHEVYLEFVRQGRMQIQDRKHFMGISAYLLKQVLLAYDIRKQAQKRGGGSERQELPENLKGRSGGIEEMTALDDTFRRLEALDPQQARIVELRFFTGLTVEETAEVLGISPATVKRDWVTAKAWLYRDISRATANQS